MGDESPRVYWDSSCFLALINGEPRSSDCRRILDDAADGKITLVTSFWTMAEVIRPRGTQGPLPEEDEEEIRAFFENDFIIFRTVDRTVAEKARELCWQHANVVYACDAVHLATAVLSGCQRFEVIDNPLESLDRMLGEPPMTIRKPQWTGQLDAWEETDDEQE